MEPCEVIVGSLEAMFNILTMADIERLHKRFVSELYHSHPAFGYLMGTKR